MKIAINKKYKYLTFEKDCPEDLDFENWAMQDKFETHSIIDISDDVAIENLRFNQFDYNVEANTFTFNIEKHNAYLKELNKPTPPNVEERLQALELIELERILGGM